MPEEQTGTPVQDPTQVASEPASAQPTTDQSAQAPASAPAYVPPAVAPAPWSDSLQQAFTSPEEQARVDAYLRANVQPYTTRLEQQVAEAKQAQEVLAAFEQDADKANIAIQRTLYGDEYADQVAMSLNRPELVVGQYQQQAQTQPAQPQQVQVPPEMQAMYDDWNEKRQEAAYDEAKASFLSDPQYADVNPELFDPFVQGAETWEEAVAKYRTYAAHFATRGQTNDPPPQPPPTIGSQAVGAPGATPAYPQHESLNDAIDDIFNGQKPGAPPVLGQQ